MKSRKGRGKWEERVKGEFEERDQGGTCSKVLGGGRTPLVLA